jgi:hypothetical protein
MSSRTYIQGVTSEYCIYKFVRRIVKAGLADPKCIHDVIIVTTGKNSDSNSGYYFRVYWLFACSIGLDNICNDRITQKITSASKSSKGIPYLLWKQSSCSSFSTCRSQYSLSCLHNFKKSQTKTRIFTRIVEVLRKTHTPSPRITSAAMPFNVPQQRDTNHDEEVWKTP